MACLYQQVSASGSARRRAEGLWPGAPTLCAAKLQAPPNAESDLPGDFDSLRASWWLQAHEARRMLQPIIFAAGALMYLFPVVLHGINGMAIA